MASAWLQPQPPIDPAPGALSLEEHRLNPGQGFTVSGLTVAWGSSGPVPLETEVAREAHRQVLFPRI